MRSRVTEVVLVHRDGTFLGRHPPLATTSVDWTAQALALLKMMDAVAASFASGSGGLQDLRLGDTTLHLDVGEHLVLVTVVEGRVRPALARRLRDVLEDIELNYHAALAKGERRPDAFEGLDDFLRRLVTGG